MGGFGKLKKKVYRCLVGQVSCGFGPLLENKGLLRTNEHGEKAKNRFTHLESSFLIAHSLSEFIIIYSACKHPQFNYFFKKENYPISYSVFPSSYFSFLWFTKRKKIGKKKHEINKAIRL